MAAIALTRRPSRSRVAVKKAQTARLAHALRDRPLMTGVSDCDAGRFGLRRSRRLRRVFRVVARKELFLFLLLRETEEDEDAAEEDLALARRSRDRLHRRCAPHCRELVGARRQDVPAPAPRCHGSQGRSSEIDEDVSLRHWPSQGRPAACTRGTSPASGTRRFCASCWTRSSNMCAWRARDRSSACSGWARLRSS